MSRNFNCCPHCEHADTVPESQLPNNHKVACSAGCNDPAPTLDWASHWDAAGAPADPSGTEPFEWANELAIELLASAGGQPDTTSSVEYAQTYLTLAFMHFEEVGDLVKDLLAESDQLRQVKNSFIPGKHRASTKVTLCPKCRTALLTSPDEEHPCLEDDEAPRSTSPTWGPWGPEGRQGF